MVLVYVKFEQQDINLLTLVPQILTNFEPIMGNHRKTLDSQQCSKFEVYARKSKMTLSRYISTLLNIQYAKEFNYQKYCLEKYGGRREVPVAGIGIIDLLTKDFVIEVKKVSQWKAALGQVLAYSTKYPNKKRKLILTPETCAYNKRTIEQVCSNYDVIVEFL